MKKYQIADFIFGIHMEESLEIPENFKKFLIDTDEEVQVEYFLEVVINYQSWMGNVYHNGSI